MIKKYNKNKIRLIILANIPVLFLLIWAMYDYRLDRTLGEKLNEEYSFISVNDSLNSTVQSVFSNKRTKKWRGKCCYAFITFTDGDKLQIGARSSIKNKDVYFGYTVAPGNVLIKRPGSDTLTLISGENKYLFILDIYEPESDTLSFIEKIFR